MHAIRLHEFGPPDNLVLDEVDDLSPMTGEVRIAVEASGVHLLDTSLRRGEAGPMPAPPLPTIPGREVAGVVDQVGDGVDPSWVGRRVVAHLRLVPGGYAEQATTTVDKLFAVPDHVGLPEAVAAVDTGRTALGVLELEAPVSGDRVLVPSAAGGLGWLLVQGARWHGAHVVAAARGPERTSRLGELNPELVVDYGDPGWAEQVQSTGISGLASRSLEHLAVKDWSPLVSTYPLGEAARAHADLEGRRALGKVVLTVHR
jgi:NADPH:quinone reductase